MNQYVTSSRGHQITGKEHRSFYLISDELKCITAYKARLHAKIEVDFIDLCQNILSALCGALRVSATPWERYGPFHDMAVSVKMMANGSQGLRWWWNAHVLDMESFVKTSMNLRCLRRSLNWHSEVYPRV